MQGLLLLTKIQKYLLAANTGAPGMSEEIIQEAGERLKDILRRTFNDQRKPGFRLSMSSAGRPACQLVMERDGAAKEAQPYSFRLKMLIGDITELVVRAVIKGSGINIDNSNGKVLLKLFEGKKDLPGEYDFKINGAIWDVKSASSWSFRNKWAMGGFKGLEKDDPFGYIGQLYGYCEADKSKAGGFFVVNKETGEMLAVEAEDAPELRKKHIAALETNILKVIDPSRPFIREFSDEEELFRKVPTGNRKLTFKCSFCDYKYSCWKGLQHRPAVKSEADNAPMVYYTVLNPETIKTPLEKQAVQEKKQAKKAKKKKDEDLQLQG